MYASMRPERWSTQLLLGSNGRFCVEHNQALLYIYTVNHKKRDILFLTITLASLNRFL